MGEPRSSLRKKVFEAHGRTCAYCGGDGHTIDHIVPKACNGEWAFNNLIPACGKCNASKAAHPLEAWFREQPFFSEARLNAVRSWQHGLLS